MADISSTESIFTDLREFLLLLFLDSNAYYGIVIGMIFGMLTGWLLARKSGTECEITPKAGNDVTYKPGESSEYKMVIVARQDLGMGKGKIAAQCSHAAVGLYRQLLYHNAKVLMKWENSASPKVVVKAPDEDTLINLVVKATALDLETCLIKDAGRTQIAPGSKTVLGIGPGPKELIDQVTGHLKLY